MEGVQKKPKGNPAGKLAAGIILCLIGLPFIAVGIVAGGTRDVAINLLLTLLLGLPGIIHGLYVVIVWHQRTRDAQQGLPLPKPAGGIFSARIHNGTRNGEGLYNGKGKIRDNMGDIVDMEAQLPVQGQGVVTQRGNVTELSAGGVTGNAPAAFIDVVPTGASTPASKKEKNKKHESEIGQQKIGMVEARTPSYFSTTTNGSSKKEKSKKRKSENGHQEIGGVEASTPSDLTTIANGTSKKSKSKKRKSESANQEMAEVKKGNAEKVEPQLTTGEHAPEPPCCAEELTTAVVAEDEQQLPCCADESISVIENENRN